MRRKILRRRTNERSSAVVLSAQTRATAALERPREGRSIALPQWNRASDKRDALMIELTPLPYDMGALAPVISAATLEKHHGAHHAAYVKKTNALAQAKGLDGVPLEHIIERAHAARDQALFNQAAQAWNHGFYWMSMAPPSTGGPESTALRDAIGAAFGGFPQFREQFLEKGAAHFASGWIWLVAKPDGALALHLTHDAATPIATPELRPVLVCDLWEHAYYLDVQNARATYLEGFIDRLCNWTFAERQFAAALKGEEGWRYPPPKS